MSQLALIFIVLLGQEISGEVAFDKVETEQLLLRSAKEISGEVAFDEVETEQLLLRSSGATEERVSELKTVLSPAFASLPKNGRSRLDWPAVRQLLFRHFVGEHGWHIKDLAPHKNPNVTADLFKGLSLGDAFPRKLIPQLQEYLANGCTLRGAAVMVAILEEVGVHSGVASLSHLKASYRFNGFSTNSSLAGSKLNKVIDSAMILFIEGGNLSDAAKHRLIRQNINRIYPGWKKTQDFARGVVRDFVREHGDPKNLSFGQVVEVMDNIGMRYGKFQEVDCQDMKSILMDMDPLHTGRVPLSDFYAKKQDGAWQFSESEEYMRSLGILDESDSAQGPQVIISNYLTSDNNCLAKSPQKNICCLHECEALLGVVEASIRRPVASPTDVLAIIQGMSSSSVNAPRQMTPVLKEALQQIAGLHQGKVPLHGRLFSQWLHYAFPNECPYPHITDSVASLTPEEWAQSFLSRKSTGANPWQVQAGVRASHVVRSQAHPNRPTSLPLAQWSLQEELLAGSADDAALDPWAEPASYALVAGFASLGILFLACVAIRHSRRQKIAVEGVTGDAGRNLLRTEREELALKEMNVECLH